MSEDRNQKPDLCGKLAASCQNNDPYHIWQWGLAKIESFPIYSNHYHSVVVAVLDSGIDTNHEDLADKVIDSVNLSHSTTATDLYGHGTHVAGIIAAKADNNIGVAGAAPNARLLNIKIAEDNGIVWAANLAQGIVWAVDHGAHVINMSLAISQKTDALEQAVKYACNHGVVLVAAAGNFTKSITYPAAFPEVIAVAALNQDDSVWSESDDGSFVSAFAPGVDIYSTLPHNNYGYYSGSSMATAHVSAVAALVLGTLKHRDINSSVNGKVSQVIKSLFPKPNR